MGGERERERRCVIDPSGRQNWPLVGCLASTGAVKFAPVHDGKHKAKRHATLAMANDIKVESWHPDGVGGGVGVGGGRVGGGVHVAEWFSSTVGNSHPLSS